MVKSKYLRYDKYSVLALSVFLNSTVNVLKFQTLLSFCSQIKCLVSGPGFTKCLSQIHK